MCVPTLPWRKKIKFACFTTGTGLISTKLFFVFELDAARLRERRRMTLRALAVKLPSLLNVFDIILL